MFCKYCGQKISSKDPKKCPSCGANINIYDYGQSYFDDGELAAWEDKSSLSASSKTVMLGVSSSHSKSSAPSFPAQSVIPETTMRKAVPTPIPSTGMPGFFAKHKLGVIICSVSIVLILTLIVVAILALNKGNDSEENLPRDPGKPTNPNTSIIVDNAPSDTSDYIAVVDVLEKGFGCTIIGRDTSSFDTERTISIKLVHNNHNYTLYFFINTNRIVIFDDQAKQTISNDEVENELKIIDNRLSGKRQELESIFKAAFNCEPNQGYYDPSGSIPQDQMQITPGDGSGNQDLNLNGDDIVFTFHYDGKMHEARGYKENNTSMICINDIFKSIGLKSMMEKGSKQGALYTYIQESNYNSYELRIDFTIAKDESSKSIEYKYVKNGQVDSPYTGKIENKELDKVHYKNDNNTHLIYITVSDLDNLMSELFPANMFPNLNTFKFSLNG